MSQAASVRPSGGQEIDGTADDAREHETTARRRDLLSPHHLVDDGAGLDGHQVRSDEVMIAESGDSDRTVARRDRDGGVDDEHGSVASA